jgi:hypothetical protein
MGTHMITAHGAEYHLAGAYQTDNAITIETIAHALSQINRFTGHATRPYSVAEHSLLCADVAERLQLSPFACLAALMHDAHEAYTGDVSSPAKQALGDAWSLFEATHARAVRRHFGMLSVFENSRKKIHQCDLVALATERRDLMAWDAEISSPWPILDTPGKVVPCADWVDLNQAQREQRHWTEWRELFLERFHALRLANAEWFKANVREHFQ